MYEFPLTWAQVLVDFLEDEYGVYAYAEHDGNGQYVELPLNPGFIEIDRYGNGWTLSYIDLYGTPGVVSSFEELCDLVYSEFTKFKE